jgi:EmrB/QacA subfamily drug resistance transporter
MRNVRTDLTTTQRWVLALTSIGSFMVVLDMLVVATALTAIQRDLGASIEQLEWTVNAYTLSFAVLLMTAASLGDRFGRRRLFVAGLVLFAAASGVCALSPDITVLIVARAVQGAGAATVMPLALALLNAAFPTEQRGRALGVYGSATGFGAVLGPVLGGLITQDLSWQWIFWLNVPVGLLAVPFVLAKINEGFGRGTALDLRGLVLFTLAALGLVWGLVRVTAVGWADPQVVMPLIAGAVLLAGFVWWERRADEPMLPLRLFRSRAFSAGNTAIFVFNAALTGVIFFTAQYQQVVLGQGPLGAGLRMLPWGITPFVLAPWTGSLADRVGERSLVVIGLGMQAAGIAWLAMLSTPDASYALLVVPMTVIGAGFALAIPALTKVVVTTNSPADLGKASGAFTTMRQLGGAFGVAILATVFAAAGGYGSAATFSSGYVVALVVAAGLSLAGAVLGAVLPNVRAKQPVMS